MFLENLTTFLKVAMFYFQFALRRKIQAGKKEQHWLDSAKEKYDPKFVEDIKGLLKVFVLFIPLPLFWSLFKQQVAYSH